MADGEVLPMDIFEANRAAWNEALEYHQKARNNALQNGFRDPAFTTLDRDCDDVLLQKLKGYDFAGKTIAQLPCNNGRELLSLMRLGARQGIGFDISDNAIAEARQLANISGLNAVFERTNILEIASRYNGCFDFIYISEGSLQWFPNLGEYFAVVGRLLKPGGTLFIFEMHPFAYFFENGFNPAQPNFSALTPYFAPGPYSYADGLDYVGGVQYKAKTCHWFMHTLSDILGALIQNGIVLQTFEEYNLEMANNARTGMLDKFPLSYILTGEKG